MTAEGREIVVDSREPWERVFDYLEEYNAPQHRLEALENKADFVVDNAEEVAIQRKEVNDFVGSLDTLKDDLFELRTHHDNSALLIEGRWRVSSGGVVLIRRGSSWSQTIPVEHLHKFVLSQQLRGTLFIRTTDLRETCQWLVNAFEYMDGSVQAGPSSESPVVLLTLFPGIGPGLAEEILEEYGTVGDALSNVENWEDVHGIGAKTIESVDDWLY